MRCLVTAGSTRERIDAVRDWGNIFTGNTGWALAGALAELGPVDLLTSNRAHLDLLRPSPGSITGHEFQSHAELKSQLTALMANHAYSAIFMSAAVTDYEPAQTYEIIERVVEADGERWTVRNVQRDKVKSSYAQIAVRGTPTEKLVDLFRSTWHFTGMLVKFKLEAGIDDQQLIDIGQASRRASHADFLVANTLAMVTGPRAGAYLLSDTAVQWIARPDLPATLRTLAREWPHG